MSQFQRGTHEFFKIEPITNPIKNEAEIALMERGLANLPNPSARDILASQGRIITLKIGQTKIAHRCPKSRMVMVIDFNETSKSYRLFNGNINEYECDCGTIFRKEVQ